jgi:DNA-binding transcriptional regulator YiaG
VEAGAFNYISLANRSKHKILRLTRRGKFTKETESGSMEKEEEMVFYGKEVLIACIAQNRSDEEIAQILNISVPNVLYLRKLYGLEPKSRDRRQTALVITREELLQLQRELKTDKNISERLGYTLSQVFLMRKVHNIPMLHKGNQENVIGQDSQAKIRFHFERIREIRCSRKIKQYDLAQRLGISTTHLRNYEHGKRFPRTKLLIQILNELKINPNYLFLAKEPRKYID